MLENKVKEKIFCEDDYFSGKFNYIHTYLHQNYNFRVHSHQFYEMNIIVAGEGVHLIENSSIKATVGDVFVIPPGIKHGYIADKPLDVYHILIKNDFLSRYSEELSQINGFSVLFDIEPQIRRVAGKRYNLRLGTREVCFFVKDLEKMTRVENEGRYVYLNALMTSLLCRLCRRITLQTNDSESTRDVIAVMDYIKNNLDDKLTLEKISEFANMSKATLNRRFCESIGTSPMNYVTACRVKKAKQLLCDDNISKTEIAQICGFYDTSHMNKMLEKFTT